MPTYSLKKTSNDPASFPPVQTWMSWVADLEIKKVKGEPVFTEAEETYRRSDGTEHSYMRRIYEYVETGDGKLRHYWTLPEAKKKLAWLGSKGKYRMTPGKFMASWALYEWVDGEWVLRYSGERGESRDSHPLWLLRFTKDQQVHAIDKKREEEALAAIERAMLKNREAAIA